jgi:hypothetical protein
MYGNKLKIKLKGDLNETAGRRIKKCNLISRINSCANRGGLETTRYFKMKRFLFKEK